VGIEADRKSGHSSKTGKLEIQQIRI